MTDTRTRRRQWREAVWELGFDPNQVILTLICDYNDQSAALTIGDDYYIDGHLYRIITRDFRLASSMIILDLVEGVVFEVAEYLVESRSLPTPRLSLLTTDKL